MPALPIRASKLSIFSTIAICCFFIGRTGLGQTSARLRNASVLYQGVTIFEFKYPSAKGISDPDDEFLSCVGWAERSMTPTEHFCEAMGTEDDSGWLVIKNNTGKTPFYGELAMSGEGTGVSWLEEIRIKKIKKTDGLGDTKWMLDIDSLFKARKKRFLLRPMAPQLASLQETRAPWVAGTPTFQAYEQSLESKTRTLTISLLKGNHPVFQGTLECDETDSDQLWKHCMAQVAKGNVGFNNTSHAIEALRELEGNGRDIGELVFESTKEQRIAINVEGVGLILPDQIVLSSKKLSDDSFWIVTSIVGLDEEYWWIRRNMVPYLKKLRKNKTSNKEIENE